MNRGILYGIGAYALWGFLPIYWKQLQNVSALEILGNRMVWSLVFCLLLLTLLQKWSWLPGALGNRRTMLTIGSAAGLITINWGLYIWAVNSNFIVETSLGYFINPLVSVVIGVIVLHEALRPWQWLAIGVAALGVLYMTVTYGRPPWIALTLAFSFAFYGLLKKKARLPALEGLTLETAFMTPVALIYLVWLQIQGAAAFGHAGLTTDFLLISAGAITAVPLLLFAVAAQSIPLSMVGILQYIAPTLQFLIGVFMYHEPFDRTHLIGFSLIWLALIIYTIENLNNRRRVRMPARSTLARS
ncbi:MAG: EamA family transporter RarD [Caldilineaceae bacterium]|nr:EamA family transporter RarD [Caldilineaceae bacterium]